MWAVHGMIIRKREAAKTASPNQADDADPLAEIFPSSWVALVQDPRADLACLSRFHALSPLFVLLTLIAQSTPRAQTPPSTGTDSHYRHCWFRKARVMSDRR